MSSNTIIRIKVTPNAQKTECVGYTNDELTIKLNAQPEEGKANKELIAFLSKELKIAKNQIVITHGARSRHKTIALGECDQTKLSSWKSKQ